MTFIQKVEGKGEFTKDHPMDSKERAERIGNLFRSILPQDLYQMLFVFSVVCFWIAPQLEWGPAFQSAPLTSLTVVPLLAPYAFSFAAATSCFLFFRPGRKPITNLLWWVCAPALAGLFVVCVRFIQFAFAARSIIDGASIYGIMSLLVFTAKGFHWALGGFVLVAVFTGRVWLGYSSLPLALERVRVASPDSICAWRNLHLVIGICLSGVWKLFFWFVGIAVAFALSRSPQVLRQEWIFYVILYFLGLLGFIGLAVWMNGREILTAVLRSVRLPAPESFLLACALPFCAVFVGSLVYYLFDLLRWAVEGSSTYLLPHFASFFRLPSPERIASLFPAVFVEEVIFRAVLLRQFVIRYGVLRGLVLVSVLFAAWHYETDFSRNMNDGEVVSHLCIRSLELVSTGVVLGWLTIRTRSILPAALAHAVFNAFSGSSMGGSSASLWSPFQAMCISFSLGLLVCILLRYWPIQAGNFQANAQLPLFLDKHEQKIHL
jgi:membrane protease YdiL (CAAX protease family)